MHCCNRKACTWREAGSVGRVWGWIRGRVESEGQGLFLARERRVVVGGRVVRLGDVEQGSMPEEALWRECRI